MEKPLLSGTCIIVLDQTGTQVLLGKRKNGYGEGNYGLPGGMVESGELLIDAAKRELKEETDIQTGSLSYVGVIREQRIEDTFIHFVFHHLVLNQKPKLMEPEKCTAWEWFMLNDLPENLLSAHLSAILLFQSPNKDSYRDIAS